MSTTDRALRIMQGVGEAEGFLAWKELQKELSPQAPQRFLGMLQGLLSVSLGSLAEVLDKLSRWGQSLAEYERDSGLHQAGGRAGRVAHRAE
eukprot:4344476-Alexandrium_andersonii.AAC.1